MLGVDQSSVTLISSSKTIAYLNKYAAFGKHSKHNSGCKLIAVQLIIFISMWINLSCPTEQTDSIYICHSTLYYTDPIKRYRRSQIQHYQQFNNSCWWKNCLKNQCRVMFKIFVSKQNMSRCCFSKQKPLSYNVNDVLQCCITSISLLWMAFM